MRSRPKIEAIHLKSMDKLNAERGAFVQKQRVRYSKEIGDYICDQIAHGRSLLDICKEPRMPTDASVHLWLIMGDDAGFTKKYDEATRARAQHWAEELTTIADNDANDYIEDPDTGKIKLNAEHVSRAKLRIETRKWVISKILPKYADASTVRLANASGGDILPPAPQFVILPVRGAKESDDS